MFELAIRTALRIVIYPLIFSISNYQPAISLPAIFSSDQAITHQANNTSYQESAFSLNRDELQQPLYLEVRGNRDTEIFVEIYFGDRLLETVEGKNTRIDLTNLLQTGSNTFMIVGHYQPAIGSVTVEVKSKNNRSTLTSGGNGNLQQKLTIHVF